MFPGLTDEDTVPSDPVMVKNAWVTGGLLNFDVSYSGGCERHDFAVCLRTVGKATPPFVRLELVHDSHEDSCEALSSDHFSFSLELLQTDITERNSMWNGELNVASDTVTLQPCDGPACPGYVEPAADSCIRENPAGSQDAEEWTDFVTSEADGCSAAGAAIPAQVISSRAAVCAAQAAGLPAGLGPLQVELSCQDLYDTVVWEVRNTTEADASGLALRGTGYVMDAATGALLGILDW